MLFGRIFQLYGGSQFYWWKKLGDDGIGLWCLRPLSTMFQFYWWRKLEYLEKTTVLPQVTDKLDQIIFFFYIPSIARIYITLDAKFAGCF
jgi:hypothetical protein